MDVFTPDDIMAGRLPEGPVLVYDEDDYYMGGVNAEKLHAAGLKVTLATPAENVSPWAKMMGEHWRIRTHLMDLGVELILSHALSRFDGGKAMLECTYSGRLQSVPVVGLVMVTQRKPDDRLYRDLLAKVEGHADKLPFTLKRIGDCEAPAIIAAAVYAGHR